MDFGQTKSLIVGEKLFRERDPSREIYYLRVGTVLMLRGDVIIAQIKAPAFVGELGAVLGIPRSLTLMAKTAASVDVYAASEMLAKLSIQSDLGTKFIHSLNERFELLRDRAHEYQYLILGECKKILSVSISEKRISDQKLPFGEMKSVRRDVEMAIDQVMKMQNAAEDYAGMQQMAKRQSAQDKFESAVQKRFSSFTLHDLKSHKIPRIDTFSDFREASRFICEKIAFMLKCLAEYQALGLSHLESELVMMEETLPFAAREQILKEQLLQIYAKGSLDDFRRQVTEFDRAVKSLAEETGRTDMPMAPIAKKFGIEEGYMKSLQTKWKEFLRK